MLLTMISCLRSFLLGLVLAIPPEKQQVRASPVTAQEQGQQCWRRGWAPPWHPRTHPPQIHLLAADMVRKVLLAAGRMHAVTAHMGHSLVLHMHSVQNRR